MSACDSDGNLRLELIQSPVVLRRSDFNESSFM